MARARVLRWVLVALSATLAVVLIVAGNTVAGVLIRAAGVRQPGRCGPGWAGTIR